MFNYTARPTYRTHGRHSSVGSELGYTDALSHKDLLYKKENRPAIGICTNPRCYRGVKVIASDTGFEKDANPRKVTEDQGKNYCPHCRHALFWSRKWDFARGDEEAQEKARKWALNEKRKHE